MANLCFGLMVGSTSLENAIPLCRQSNLWSPIGSNETNHDKNDYMYWDQIAMYMNVAMRTTVLEYTRGKTTFLTITSMDLHCVMGVAFAKLTVVLDTH